MSLPAGYELYAVHEDYIIVGMIDFLLMFEDAVEEIEYNENVYLSGLLEFIPKSMIGRYCSMRRYNLSPDGYKKREMQAVIPEPNTIWKHRTGKLYTVVVIANRLATDKRYPITVVYKDGEDNIWTRPFSDWYQSMTAVK